MMVPWTIRNAVRLDAFVPTSTNTGDTLCLDRFEGANGGFRWADHEGCADPELPEVELNSDEHAHGDRLGARPPRPRGRCRSSGGPG